MADIFYERVVTDYSLANRIQAQANLDIQANRRVVRALLKILEKIDPENPILIRKNRLKIAHGEEFRP